MLRLLTAVLTLAAVTTAAPASLPAFAHDTEPQTETSVTLPAWVRVTTAENTTVVETHSREPREVLAAAGLRVGRLDQVVTIPDRDSGHVSSGDTVRLVRVSRDASRTRVTLESKTVRRKTDALRRGVRKVKRDGRDGYRVFRTVVETHDGLVASTSRTLVATRKPVSRLVLVGTRRVRYAHAVPDRAEDLNWRALARCESSNNPRAYNPAGYYGLYQFDLSTWRSVGGAGVPTDASRREQTYRAQLLYASRGAQPWPVCGRHL